METSWEDEIAAGNIEALKRRIEIGKWDVNKASQSKFIMRKAFFTPLSYAIEHDQVEVVSLLLNSGARVDVPAFAFKPSSE